MRTTPKGCRVNPGAAKGLILNARILWTFSAVHRLIWNPTDRDLAGRAYQYLMEKFHDPVHGGYSWEFDPLGNAIDDKKKVYGQAFCVYALSEYHRTFDDPAALR